MSFGRMGAGGLGFGSLGSLLINANSWQRYTHNFSQARLSRWATARSAVLAGSADATVLAVGDSKTLGASSGTEARCQRSWPAQTGALLTARGVLANVNSAFTEGNVGLATVVSAYDSRLSFGASWSTVVGTAYRTFGGQLLQSPSASNWSWTVADCDTFDLWYVKTGGAGSISIDVDGGAATVISTNASSSVQKYTVTVGSVGTHTINVKWSAGSTVYGIGLLARKSATKSVNILNGGASGAEAGWYNDSTFVWNGTAMIGTLAPALTIFDLGINNVLNGGSTSTFKTDMQVAITKALLTGDVIICAPQPINPAYNANSTLARQLALRDACYELSDTNNCVLIDKYKRFGSYEAGNAAGWYAGDGVHDTTSGYGIDAKLITDVLLAA